jgi:hypothetical protein
VRNAGFARARYTCFRQSRLAGKRAGSGETADNCARQWRLQPSSVPVSSQEVIPYIKERQGKRSIFL